MLQIDLTSPETVITFWFKEVSPEQWWKRSDVFDQRIRTDFGALHQAAQRGELYAWRETARGRLAEIIILDQFSRNIYRDDRRAFACDPMALALAQSAVSARSDLELDAVHRAFLYMPYMHSESAMIHVAAISLFSAPGLEKDLAFELRHKAIIDRFDRFPHRNAILGRQSTPEETAFLMTEGSSF